MTTLEVHAPISPVPHFFNRMHYLAASLQEYGGAFADAKLVVTVGDDCEPYRIELPWITRYPVEFRWLDRELYHRHSYFATRLRRFDYDFDSEVILMLDPDVIAVGSIEDLILQALRSQVFLGRVAGVPPQGAAFTWEGLFAAAGLPMPPRELEHSGFGLKFYENENRACPAYFNLGMMCAPASLMRRIGTTIMQELQIAERFSNFFRAQPAITLALYRHGIPWKEVGARYNFPNDMRFVRKYPEEFAEIRLAHYLRYDNMNRERDFETPATFGALLARQDLNEANRAIFDRLARVHERVLADLV